MGRILKTKIYYAKERVLGVKIEIPWKIETLIKFDNEIEITHYGKKMIINGVGVSTVFDYEGNKSSVKGRIGETRVFPAKNKKALDNREIPSMPNDSYDENLFDAIKGHQEICLEIIERY